MLGVSAASLASSPLSAQVPFQTKPRHEDFHAQWGLWALVVELVAFEEPPPGVWEVEAAVEGRPILVVRFP